MRIVCLDLEGVLVPEIWISFSEKTGIKELSLTTRDISDYDILMKKRINILNENKLTLKDIQEVIKTLDPLDGAKEFMNTLREQYQVIILSDTFTQFAKPLMEKLSWPTIFCNSLVVSNDNAITDYTLRQKDGKKHAVKALQSIGYKIIAAGDSYNDLSMLKTAEKGILFCAPATIKSENKHIPAVDTYEHLLKEINSF